MHDFHNFSTWSFTFCFITNWDENPSSYLDASVRCASKHFILRSFYSESSSFTTKTKCTFYLKMHPSGGNNTLLYTNTIDTTVEQGKWRQPAESRQTDHQQMTIDQRNKQPKTTSRAVGSFIEKYSSKRRRNVT